MGAAKSLAAGHAVKFAGQGDIFGAPQTGNQGIGLRHVSDGSAQFSSRLNQIAPKDTAATRRRRQQPHQYFEQRRFAGPIGAEQADSPRLQMKRDIAQRRLRSVPAMDVMQLD